MMIAYKRADNPKSKVGFSLPANFITEWRILEFGEVLPANEGWITVQDTVFHALLNNTNTQANIDTFVKSKIHNPNDGYAPPKVV